MARSIDGDALIAWIKGSQQMTSKMKSIICYIKTMPTIDAVEVVRCRECKYWRNTNAEKIPTASIACGNMHHYDFCSYGERKETEHE